MSNQIDLAELSNYKHISEISEEDQQRAVEMAQEIKELLEKHVVEDSQKAGAHMERIKQLKKEIKKIGFLVQTKTNLKIAENKLETEAEVIIFTLRLNPQTIQ